MLQTELTRLLGIRLPIVQAPMAGGPTTPELVAAASGAGGLGIFAGAALSLDVLEQAIAAIGEVTFGVTSGTSWIAVTRVPPAGSRVV